MKSILKETHDDQSVATGNSTTSVCWGDLTFYQFRNILGDNPGVSEGAPLSIEWKHTKESVLAIDYHEFIRQSRPRRKRKALIIPSGARDTFLLGQGYSLEELLKAAEETKKIRASRRASMKGTNWDKFKRLGMRIMNKTNAQKTQTAPKIYAARTG